jgi:hypothetical protein
MALAFPGQASPLWEVMARDAFVESLGDPAMRLRVLERDPTTLEEALKISSRLEALSCGDVDERWDNFGHRKDKFVNNVVTEDNGKGELMDIVQELRKELKQNHAELDRLRRRVDPELVAGMSGHQLGLVEPVGPAPYPGVRYTEPPAGFLSAPPPGFWQAPTTYPRQQPPPSTYPESPVSVQYQQEATAPPAWYSTGDRAADVNIRLRQPRRSRDNDQCRFCRQRGHWKAECPQRQRTAHGASSTLAGTRTYLDISVGGRSSTCLLDTGCEQSMLPRRYVPHAQLTPTEIKVFAANGTNIPVLGTVGVCLEAAGLSVQARFLVSDTVDEPMLGIDWLVANGCSWDFVNGIVTIGGREIRLSAARTNRQSDVCMCRRT